MEDNGYDSERLEAQAHALLDEATEIASSFAGFEWGKSTYWHGTEGRKIVGDRQRVLLNRARVVHGQALDLAGQCEMKIAEHRQALEREQFTFEVEPGTDRLSNLMIESFELRCAERALAISHGAAVKANCVVQFVDGAEKGGRRWD